MRDEVLMQLVDKAMTDDTFRAAAVEDLDGTLRAHDFELEPDELAAVREFHGEVIASGDVVGALGAVGSSREGGA
jgi:hypothetical protein